MKKCPYCAEKIKDEAIVCRYCGKDLVQPQSVIPNEGQMPSMGQQISSSDIPELDRPEKRLRQFSQASLLLGIIALCYNFLATIVEIYTKIIQGDKPTFTGTCQIIPLFIGLIGSVFGILTLVRINKERITGTRRIKTFAIWGIVLGSGQIILGPILAITCTAIFVLLIYLILAQL